MYKHVNDMVCYLTPAVLGPKNCNPCYDPLNSLMVKCHNPWTPNVNFFLQRFVLVGYNGWVITILVWVYCEHQDGFRKGSEDSKVGVQYPTCVWVGLCRRPPIANGRLASSYACV